MIVAALLYSTVTATMYFHGGLFVAHEMNGDTAPQRTTQFLRAVAAAALFLAADGVKAAEPTPLCRLALASELARVIVLAASEGSAVSTVALGTTDQKTTVGTIRVEAGSEPLYVILPQSEDIIWTFEGQVARVAAAILPKSLQASRRGGVVGLDAAKVVFPPPGECFPKLVPTYRGVPTTAEYGQYFEAAIGRKPDLVAAGNGLLEVGTAYIPSGKVESGREGPPPRSSRTTDQAAWRELLKIHPRGIVTIDPRNVVSEDKVTPYDVMPEHAGVVQLLRQGRLRRTGPFTFKIVRPLARFPMGLGGPLSVTFILPEDVPMPGGSRSQSCVLSEESGRPIPGLERDCERVERLWRHSVAAPPCCSITLTTSKNGFVYRSGYYSSSQISDLQQRTPEGGPRNFRACMGNYTIVRRQVRWFSTSSLFKRCAAIVYMAKCDAPRAGGDDTLEADYLRLLQTEPPRKLLPDCSTPP